MDQFPALPGSYRLSGRFWYFLTQSNNLNLCRSISYYVQLFCCSISQINDPFADKRSTVVNPYHGWFTIVEIFYQQHGVHGQGFVGSSMTVHVVGLTIGSLAAVKFFAVPGGKSFFTISFSRRNGIIGTMLYNVRTLSSSFFNLFVRSYFLVRSFSAVTV